MVRGKKASPNKDVDIEVKVNLVMEMKLFKAGASKYSTVSSLAKAIAGVSSSCAHKYVRKFESPGGLSNLTPRRVGNKNASKMSPTKVKKMQDLIANNREANCRELGVELNVSPNTANQYRTALGYKPHIARNRRGR